MVLVKFEKDALINTWLQPGDYGADQFSNRFNGLPIKTVQTVSDVCNRPTTALKCDANGISNCTSTTLAAKAPFSLQNHKYLAQITLQRHLFHIVHAIFARGLRAQCCPLRQGHLPES